MSKTSAVISNKTIDGVKIHSVRCESCLAMIHDEKTKEILFVHESKGCSIETDIDNRARRLTLFDDAKEMDAFIKDNGLKYSSALLREMEAEL